MSVLRPQHSSFVWMIEVFQKIFLRLGLGLSSCGWGPRMQVSEQKRLLDKR